MEESRREFIKKSCCALGMAAMATQMEHLGAIGALAQKAIDDGKVVEGGASYKALVCVFLAGGNDGNNTVIPNHSDATGFGDSSSQPVARHSSEDQ